MNRAPRNLEISYIQSATTKIETLNTLWVKARMSDWSPDKVSRLMEFAHCIRSTGCGYGFPKVSKAAFRLQHLLEEDGSLDRRLASLFDARQALESELRAVTRGGNALISIWPKRTN